MDLELAWPDYFCLQRDVVFLNHGSFGAALQSAVEAQKAVIERIERQPMQFFTRDYENLVGNARDKLAAFVDADTDGLVWLDNATGGVNTVLRSLTFRPGDEILVTNHGYPACNNAVSFVAKQSGAKVVVAEVPFPLTSAEQVVESVLAATTARTRLVVIDHITSPTALVFPIERVVHELDARGIDTLVDGAHAPGMLDLSIRRVGAAYYTGNCHKWMCTPKGAAFLHVRADRRQHIHPLTISHGYSPTGKHFRAEHDWTGTRDPSPWLAVPAAIDFISSHHPGGWAAYRQRNRALAIAARKRLGEALDLELPCPEDMLGTMAALTLPAGSGAPTADPVGIDPLTHELFARANIEVPVFPWPQRPSRVLRICAQLYNRQSQYEVLVRALADALAP